MRRGRARADDGGQLRRSLRRAGAGVAVVLALVLAASATLFAVGGGHHAEGAAVHVEDGGQAPTALHHPVKHRHLGHPGYHVPHDRYWWRDPAAPLPAGVRPGPGLPTPKVLSPAQELADVGHLPPGWRASVRILRIDDVARSYLVVAPVLSGAPAHSLPLYLALHGRGANPDVMARITSLEFGTGPAVIVYPAGYETSWNAGGCCGYAHADGIDDVAFVHAVVDQILADYPAVSAGRVYAIGFSNGGRMTYRLACQLPGTLAGIAAVEAVPVIHCRRMHPLDVEIIAQRGDPLLSISDEAARKTMDGYLEPTVSSAVSWWRTLDGCAPSARVGSVGDASQRTWGCRDGTRLQYTLYPGGAHRWPGGGRDRPSADRIILGFLTPPPHATS